MDRTDGVEIDVVVLSPDQRPLHPQVLGGLRRQTGVRLHVHRVLGRSLPSDPHRWSTIARARNKARYCGRSPWVLFLDDDVELPPGGVFALWQALVQRSNHAALAIDYLNDLARIRPRGHVAMGATLIRRSVLSLVRFRWRQGRCECQCFCDDLRLLGWAVDYLPGLTARHLKRGATPGEHAPGDSMGVVVDESAGPPQILVALDRRHIEKFRRQFLRSLRALGNQDAVHVVAYGLYPSEQRRMAGLPNVVVHPLPVNGVMPPIRRVRDFQPLVAALLPGTAVAYWDAGDVVFQSSLQPLWQLVHQHRGRLLACREPTSHPANPAVAKWTLSIRDPACRRRAYQLLARSPFLNSGFAAGTASAMLHYLQSAERSLRSSDLAGTSDWGDQTALNFYCHSQPQRWHEIEQGWNYCLHSRPWGEVCAMPTGRLVSRRGTPIYVVHGNARSERKLALSQ